MILGPVPFKDVPMGALCGNHEHDQYIGWKKIRENGEVVWAKGPGTIMRDGATDLYERSSQVYWICDEDVIP